LCVAVCVRLRLLSDWLCACLSMLCVCVFVRECVLVSVCDGVCVCSCVRSVVRSCVCCVVYLLGVIV